MKEQKLKDYLNIKTKEDLENIIISHYKFVIKQLEKTKKEYDGFLKQGMNLCAESTNCEYKFILLQARWYEDFITEKIKEVE